MDLVWEVISQQESEEYYDIQLSYRPLRGYAGQPGIEQFTIDKSGPITLRQILSEPRPKRGPVPVLAAVGAVVVVVATVAGLFVAGVFSSSPDVVSVSISVSPDAPARLVSPGGDVTVDVPPGSMANAAQLTYRPLALTDIPVLPSTYTATQTVFELTTDASLLKAITVTVRVSAADAVAAGSDEANLLIQQYHDDAWTPLDTNVDFAASTATAQVDRLSFFALTVRQRQAGPTPTDTPVAPTDTPPVPTSADAAVPPTDTPVPPTDTPVPPTIHRSLPPPHLLRPLTRPFQRPQCQLPCPRPLPRPRPRWYRPRLPRPRLHWFPRQDQQTRLDLLERQPPGPPQPPPRFPGSNSLSMAAWSSARKTSSAFPLLSSSCFPHRTTTTLTRPVR